MTGRKGKSNALVRTLAFLLCLLVAVSGVDAVIGHSNTQIEWIHAFRAQDAVDAPKNSFDVITIGASPNISGFSPMEAYCEYGFTSFAAGVGFGSDFAASYLLLDKMLAEQTPEVVAVEVRSLFKEGDNRAFRVISDTVGTTSAKIQLLEKLPEEYLIDSKSSYVLPLLKYHSRYKNITADDFFETPPEKYLDYFFGFKALHGTMKVESCDYPMKESGQEVTAEPHQVYYLERIIDLCKENGIELVFYKIPNNKTESEWNVEKHKFMTEFAKGYDIPFVDLNTIEAAQEMGFDPYEDFKDVLHVNFLGAVKTTRYLAKYLSENYDLPDHRGDPQYAFFEEELDRYERVKYNENYRYAEGLTEYLGLLTSAEQGGYTVLMSVRDEAFKKMDGNLQKKLAEMGFQSEFSEEASYRHSFIGVWSDGKVQYEHMSQGIDDPERDALEYYGTLPDGMKYRIQSAGYHVGKACSIVIDDTEYSKNKRGLNIVVYDNELGYVVDSVTFDTYKDAGISFTR